MAEKISVSFYEEILEKTLEQVSFDKYGYASKGKEELASYLDSARISETEKAQIYANWIGQVTSNAIQQAIQSATQIATANGELEIRNQTVADEILKLKAETALVASQQALVDKQALTETQNTTKVQNEASLVSAQKLLVDAQELTADAQTALLVEQKESENKKNEVGGLIDKEKDLLTNQASVQSNEASRISASTTLIQQQQVSEQAKTNPVAVVAGSLMAEETELKKQQALSFQLHPAKTALDAMTNVMQMQAAAGSATSDPLVENHAKVVRKVAESAGIDFGTLAEYGTI